MEKIWIFWVLEAVGLTVLSYVANLDMSFTDIFVCSTLWCILVAICTKGDSNGKTRS